MSVEQTRRHSLELLGVEAVGVAAAERVVDLAVKDISPNPFQPRTDFPAETIKELADSVKAHGLQQPIIVRQAGRPAAPGGKAAGAAYQLVAGERRLRAHQYAGLKTIRAVVRDVQDKQLLALALVENIHREDLSLMDRAVSFCRFRDELCGRKTEAAAARLGISRASGFNYAKIGDAPEELRKAIAKNGLDTRGAKFLLGLHEKVTKEQPQKLEDFETAIFKEPIGFNALKELHEKYFPTAEKPAVVEADRAGAKAPEKSGSPEEGFWRTVGGGYRLKLELEPYASTNDLRKAARAAEKFFKAAGFKKVKIEP